MTKPRRPSLCGLEAILLVSTRMLCMGALGLALATSCTHADSKDTAQLTQSRDIEPLVQEVIKRTLDPKLHGAAVELSSRRILEPGSSYIIVPRAGGIALPAIAQAERLATELKRFIEDRAELAETGHYLGVWQDARDKLIYYDVIVIFPYSDSASHKRALTQANERALRERQKTIHDLGSGKNYMVEAGKAGHELTEI